MAPRSEFDDHNTAVSAAPHYPCTLSMVDIKDKALAAIYALLFYRSHLGLTVAHRSFMLAVNAMVSHSRSNPGWYSILNNITPKLAIRRFYLTRPAQFHPRAAGWPRIGRSMAVLRWRKSNDAVRSTTPGSRARSDS